MLGRLCLQRNGFLSTESLIDMSDIDRWPNASNLAFVEGLYAEYLRDPQAVDEQWRDYFEGVKSNGTGRQAVGPSFKPRTLFNPARGNGHSPAPASASPDADDTISTSMQHRVDKLIRNYRVRGHNMARLNPLGIQPPEPRELDPAFYGFSEADMDRPFSTDWLGASRRMTLREIIRRLRNTYCRYIGVQYMHIDDYEIRLWLQQRMELVENRIELDRAEQLRILTRLTDAVILEQFIQKKFTGAKSFSLEGAESLIPLLDMTFEVAGEQDVNEIVLGMAHRGRLNVLANILGKSPKNIFREFEDRDPELQIGGGDVKYHLGHSGDWETSTGKNVHLSLCFNPSHLEYVNPVALGRMRAKQDRSGKPTRGEGGFVLLIHGDAAFAGEGIVQETLNLSELPGYTTGGTLHVIINNQLGFTTGPEEGRSSQYCTDVAKLLQIPMIHVNGEDPEAVAQAVRLAMDFRYEFKRDVVIDMYCYRRRGHNEGDEPRFTQPLMYQAIEKRPDVRESYIDHLLKLKQVTREEADDIAEQRTEHLEQELSIARSDDYRPPTVEYTKHWAQFRGGADEDVPDVDTGLKKSYVAAVLKQISTPPPDFNPHKSIARFLKQRHSMAAGEKPLNWAAAEALAFASLAMEQHPIRMSGQDSQRGTFSQRHLVLHDIEGGHLYEPLQHLAENQGPVEIYNSPLSESGVLGFEYGYSLDHPESLVLWEAQFGDFVNVAQPVIDQFISSAEDKWNRLSGIVLLLPHGFEGQGPEHSSARLERFLAQAAEDNMQVVYPSTPAQYFHVLRRQIHRPWRKPLIVMTPKSLLRNPACVSSLEDLNTGTQFKRVIGDSDVSPKKVSRVLLCTGKIYYDLLEKRQNDKRKDLAIVRVEQLYPFPHKQLSEAVSGFSKGAELLWVQEEPENMGAWRFVKHRLDRQPLKFTQPVRGVSRDESASPATGSKQAHELEQERLLAEAFGED